MKQAITFVFKENWSKTRKYCIQSKLHDKHKHACKQRCNLPKISLVFFSSFLRKWSKIGQFLRLPSCVVVDGPVWHFWYFEMYACCKSKLKTKISGVTWGIKLCKWIVAVSMVMILTAVRKSNKNRVSDLLNLKWSEKILVSWNW